MLFSFKYIRPDVILNLFLVFLLLVNTIYIKLCWTTYGDIFQINYLNIIMFDVYLFIRV